MTAGMYRIAFAKSSRHDEEPLLRSIEKHLGIRFLHIETTETTMWVHTNSSQLATLVEEYQAMLRTNTKRS